MTFRTRADSHKVGRVCVCVLGNPFSFPSRLRGNCSLLLHVYTNPPESELSAKREKQPQVSWDTGGSALSKLGEGTRRGHWAQEQKMPCVSVPQWSVLPMPREDIGSGSWNCLLLSLDTSNGSLGRFFPWVTSDQSKPLTIQMGKLELRRQKWPSLKIILAEGTESRTPKPSLLLSTLAHLFPQSPRKSSGTAVSISLDFCIYKVSYQRLVHWGSPEMRGYQQAGLQRCM